MNKISVLIVEPNKLPYEKAITNTLESLQKEVDGLIEYIELENTVDLICNEEGKVINLPYNRILNDDVIAGTFIILGNENGNTVSLSKKEIKEYKKKFNKKSIKEIEEKLVYYGLKKGGF